MAIFSYSPLLLQLILAVLLGAVVGLERSLAHKKAGMRTYALVSLGSAAFVLVSQMVLTSLPNGITFDPMRVAAQIIPGIGFLGAGLIFFNQEKLQGLTTAAGLWVAAGIGMAVGFGQYVLAIFVAILTMTIFTLFWDIEHKLEEKFEKKD